MRIEENYIYFTKGDNKITFNYIDIFIPKYINKARIRYRYNTANNIMEKQCSKCLTFYNVLQLENNEFIDIRNEDSIHLHSNKSGFASACNRCKGPTTSLTTKKSITSTVEESLNLSIVFKMEKKTNKKELGKGNPYQKVQGGSWYIFWYVTDPLTGKRKQCRKGGFRTKRETKPT
ncbi:Arm DNA-binding domain-containing protein [Clostridium sp.]|uniref:Arm DNA-binding domain-containing protein n=1 Tax=Clostridium sp. TaxID=1506 RepID=UPI0025BFA6A3|nr:Arm DNA-binding domain-containing protein [Clostridium sp.]